MVAATLFVAPLSFFVYVTQEPALAVCKNLAGRAGTGVPEVIVYLAPPLGVITGAVLVGLALRWLLPRTFAVAAGGRVPGAARGRTPTEPATEVSAAHPRSPSRGGLAHKRCGLAPPPPPAERSPAHVPEAGATPADGPDALRRSPWAFTGLSAGTPAR